MSVQRRATSVQRSGAALIVDEQHEIFAENPHRQRVISKFGLERDRLPVTAKQIPARRTPVGMRQIAIALFAGGG